MLKDSEKNINKFIQLLNYFMAEENAKPPLKYKENSIFTILVSLHIKIEVLVTKNDKRV